MVPRKHQRNKSEMGEKILARAFELAQMAIKAEQEGKGPQARDLFSASIDTFKAVLSLPGFIKDDATKKLIETEIGNLQERKTGIANRAKQDSELETRLNKLKDPAEESNLRERLDKLQGLDKPGMTREELSERLKVLKGETSSSTGATTKLDGNHNPFAGDSWKQGLDPEVLSIIEQARDETTM